MNNAGITRDSTMRRLTREQWEAVFDTNLGSCFNMSKAVWDGMNARGFGRIVKNRFRSTARAASMAR